MRGAGAGCGVWVGEWVGGVGRVVGGGVGRGVGGGVGRVSRCVEWVGWSGYGERAGEWVGSG